MMICFDVTINGTKIARSGLEDFGVMTAILTLVSRDPTDAKNAVDEVVPGKVTLDVGGMSTPDVQHVKWADEVLKSGDTLTVQVVEADAFDLPTKKDPPNEAIVEEAEKKQYARLKEKYEPAPAAALSPDACSFCGKPQKSVAKLIAGPNNARVCNECVRLGADILDDEDERAKMRAEGTRPADPVVPVGWSHYTKHFGERQVALLFHADLTSTQLREAFEEFRAAIEIGEKYEDT